MSDQTEQNDQRISQEGDEPQPLPWFTPEPPKPPERYRREEALLWVWRGVLALAMIPALMLVHLGTGGQIGFLEETMIDDPGLLPAVQFGLAFVLGAEMVYYFYLSWAFRRFKDWGLVFWAAAGVTLTLGLIYPVG